MPPRPVGRARLVALAPLVGLLATTARARAQGAARDSAPPAPASLGPAPLGPAPLGAGATRLVLDSIDLGAVSTLSELLQARVPGLVVQSGTGTPGAAPRLAARGRRTLIGASDPLLVVDGVRTVYRGRVLAADSSLAVSPLDDIPVEQIAVVEVLPGAAAAGRYGPGANDGAIVVTTRRGVAGPYRVRGYAGGGAASGREQRALWRGIGTLANGAATSDCALVSQTAGGCTLQRIEPWSPYGMVPWSSGARARLGTSVAGGERLALRGSIDAAQLGGTLERSEAGRAAARATLDGRPARGWRVALGGLAALQRAEAPPGGLGAYVARAGAPAPSAAGDAWWRTRHFDATGLVTWEARPWLTAHANGGTSVVDRDTRGCASAGAPPSRRSWSIAAATSSRATWRAGSEATARATTRRPASRPRPTRSSPAAAPSSRCAPAQ